MKLFFSKIHCEISNQNYTVMKKNYLIMIILLFAETTINAQQFSSCMNADFEQNNFNNWIAGTGDCCPVNINNSGVVPGRHTIISEAGTDQYSLGYIPFVPPGGGNYTARLGNDNTGAEAEQLTYAISVDSNNSLFIYRYAVVLQDPGHAPSDQPRFSIRVFDQNNNPVNCGTYNVVSGANIPGFINNGGYRIKPWASVGIDLSSYTGQTVTIEFTTADCGLGGHFGYAYLECYCSPFLIASEICPGGKNISNLYAPPGFTSYLWSDGDTTSSIKVSNPLVEKTYYCTLTSVTGCQITLSKVLMPVDFRAAFGSEPFGVTAIKFSDSSYVTAGPAINKWLWNFGDGNISSFQHPFHEYITGGLHRVQLITINEAGCSDTAEKEVSTNYVYYFPNAFTPNADDKNDLFSGIGFGLKEYKIAVFNRFGQLVFTSNDPDASWNGTFRNHPVPQGAYIYIVNITDFFNKTHIIDGMVNVIR